MDIPQIPEYHAPRFSGCSRKFAKFHGPNRLYVEGLKYELVLFPIIALFDFIWEYKAAKIHKRVIIRNISLDCPLQLISIGGEIDYESFTSLN